MHPTFHEREKTVADPRSQFALNISAWGEFLLYALVYFKGQTKPVELKRYLNF